MTYFSEPDRFDHISSEQIAILKEASDVEVKAFYIADTKASYEESFYIDEAEAANLIVNIADGTARGSGRVYRGHPSLADFIEYIEEGRMGDR